MRRRAIGDDGTGRTLIERGDEALYTRGPPGAIASGFWNGELAIV